MIRAGTCVFGGSAALAALLLFACGTPLQPDGQPAPPPPRPAELKGLSPGEVLGLLGGPDFRRSEPPAELWQYRTPDCILDLYFYNDAAAGFRVTDAETRARDVTGTGTCRDTEAPVRSHLARAPL